MVAARYFLLLRKKEHLRWWEGHRTVCRQSPRIRDIAPNASKQHRMTVTLGGPRGTVFAIVMVGCTREMKRLPLPT